MPDDDIPVVCTIVSTAEYCNEIVGSLGRSVAKMLDPPFGEQVCACHHACYQLKLQYTFLLVLLAMIAAVVCTAGGLSDTVAVALIRF